MGVFIVCAFDQNYGIGQHNSIPWHYPEDLKRFSEITQRAPEGKRNMVVMGRNTYDSLPDKYRPLPNRLNLVATTDNDKIKQEDSNDLVVPFCAELSLKACQLMANQLGNVHNIFICGGEYVYNRFIDDADNIVGMFITRVNIPQKINSNKLRSCDRFFPYNKLIGSFNLARSVSSSKHPELTYQYYSNKKYGLNLSENQYLQLAEDILINGVSRTDRTGTGTVSLFGKSLSFDLTDMNVPALTTKRLAKNAVLHELLWFISGSTNSKELEEKNVKIWEGNTSRAFLDSRGLDYEEGDIGAGYGFQWRHFGADYDGMDKDYTGQGIDQLKEVIQLIREEPDSRRIIMTAWNPSALNKMALPPCHMFIQFYVNGTNLEAQMYQRSADVFLGLPFNIYSYSVLTHLIAHVSGLTATKLTMCLGDAHIYSDHIDQIKTQLDRTPFGDSILKINKESKDIGEYRFEDFELSGYRCHGKIVGKMAV